MRITLPDGDCWAVLQKALDDCRDVEPLEVYKNPASKYPRLSKPLVVRPRAGNDRVRLDVSFFLDWWGFNVDHDGAALTTVHLKQSRVSGFNLTLPYDNATGVVQAGEGGQGSSSYVNWERCYIQTKGKNQRAWLPGHDGNDFCLNRWIGCSVTSDTQGATAEDRMAYAASRGNIGWSNVGGNHLNEYWESCGTSGLARGWSFLPDPARGDVQGGASSSKIVNASATHCGTVIAADAGFALDVDGRFEHCGAAIVMGPPFNVTAGRGRLDARLTLAAMVPNRNRELGIGYDGEVIGLHGAITANVSVQPYGWDAKGPIVLHSSGEGASIRLLGGDAAWAIEKAPTRGAWGTGVPTVSA